MKTLWDLIYQWKGAQAESIRLEIMAEEARQKTQQLDQRLKAALIKGGPVADGCDLYRAPVQTNDAIIHERILDAMNVPMESTLENEKEAGQ